MILSGDTVVRLGHTRLRVRGADFPLPAELADTTMHDWEGARPALAGLALIAAFATLTTWLGDSETFEPIRYLLALASGLGAGLLWSGAWAFGNRLFGVHARLGRHLFILGCGLAAMQAWKMASAIVAYAWSLEWLTRYGSHMLIGIVCMMVFFHLRTVKPRHPNRLAAACLVLLVLGSAVVMMSNLQCTGRLSDELYMALIMPPAIRLSPDHTLDAFMRNAGALKAGADADRARSANGDGADSEEQ